MHWTTAQSLGMMQPSLPTLPCLPVRPTRCALQGGSDFRGGGEGFFWLVGSRPDYYPHTPLPAADIGHLHLLSHLGMFITRYVQRSSLTLWRGSTASHKTTNTFTLCLFNTFIFAARLFFGDFFSSFFGFCSALCFTTKSHCRMYQKGKGVNKENKEEAFL